MDLVLSKNSEERTILNSVNNKFPKSTSTNTYKPGFFTNFYELINALGSRNSNILLIFTGCIATIALIDSTFKNIREIKRIEEQKKYNYTEKKLKSEIVESAIEFSKKGLSPHQYASMVTSDNTCGKIKQLLENSKILNNDAQKELNSFQELCNKKQQYDKTKLEEAASKASPLKDLGHSNFDQNYYFYPYRYQNSKEKGIYDSTIALELPDVYSEYENRAKCAPFPVELTGKLPFHLRFNESAEYKYLKSRGDKTLLTEYLPMFGPNQDLLTSNFRKFQEKTTQQYQASQKHNEK